MALMVDAGIYSYGTISLPRFGFSLRVAMENDTKQQWFQVRQMCRGMGLIDEDRQAAKVSRKWPDAVREVPVKLTGIGWRKPLCIKRKEMAMWVADIATGQVKPELRDDLDAFKAELIAEADRLLWRGKRHDEPTTTVRIEQHMACLECGTPHLVVYEDGITTVVREDE